MKTHFTSEPSLFFSCEWESHANVQLQQDTFSPRIKCCHQLFVRTNFEKKKHPSAFSLWLSQYKFPFGKSASKRQQQTFYFFVIFPQQRWRSCLWFSDFEFLLQLHLLDVSWSSSVPWTRNNSKRQQLWDTSWIKAERNWKGFCNEFSSTLT